MNQRRLRNTPFSAESILLTGASGYVGGLIAAVLLVDTNVRVIMPVRPGKETRLRERLSLELAARGHSIEKYQNRILVYEWPSAEPGRNDLSNRSRTLDHLQIEEIVHCAGCLDYFDELALSTVNEELTSRLLEVGTLWNVRRFTYISTAYAGGYLDEPIAEAPAPEPTADPTYYTRSKRNAEWLVIHSKLPWVILRPSIIIGEYANGRYSGKRYGLYQQWMGLERLLTNKYHEEIHTVAPPQPLNLIHQDVFQDSFLSAWRWLPPGAICHLVSRDQACPSMRELWDLWLSVVQPHRVYYYRNFNDVNLKAIDIRQRAYLTFAQVNLEIAAHRWCFERGWLELLEAKGLRFHDATLESVARCQDRFVASSDLLARYIQKYQDKFPTHIEFMEEPSNVLDQAT